MIDMNFFINVVMVFAICIIGSAAFYMWETAGPVFAIVTIMLFGCWVHMIQQTEELRKLTDE